MRRRFLVPRNSLGTLFLAGLTLAHIPCGLSQAQTSGRVTSIDSSRSDRSLSGLSAPLPTARPDIEEQYGKIPLSFEANTGQTDPRVQFLSRGGGYAMFLSSGGEATLVLNPSGPSDPVAQEPAGLRRAAGSAILEKDPKGSSYAGAALRLKFVGARKKAPGQGQDEFPRKVNYMLGKDPKRWRSGIPTYAKVAYEDVYPGVDLVYYGNQRQIEYDFIVSPGVDPGVITLEVEGADRLELDESGDLVLHVGSRQVRQRKPVVYQQVNGVRHEINGQYKFTSSRRVKFELASYDQSLPLIIDPVLVYATFLGGSSDDIGQGGGG